MKVMIVKEAMTGDILPVAMFRNKGGLKCLSHIKFTDPANFPPFSRIQTCCLSLTGVNSFRPSQRALNILAPIPGHVWRGVLPVAVVPLRGGLLRQRPHHRLLLLGALPGHLQTPLRLPPLRPEKGRHRLLTLLDHRHACQHTSPPLHQVG